VVIRDAADATAESKFRTERINVSRITASAKLASTTIKGEYGKKHSPSAYPQMVPPKRYPDSHCSVGESTTRRRSRSASVSSSKRKRSIALSRRPVPATTP
jgi:hypothetical protein